MDLDPLDDGTWDIDRRLWVVSRHDERGYLVGGSSTLGRFSVFWPEDGAAYSCSVSELSTCSALASSWLHGYLEGQRPAHWFSKSYDPNDPDDPRAGIHARALTMFNRTGAWRRESGQRCAQCGSPFHPKRPPYRALPSDPAGDVCFSCNPVPLDALWPRVDDDASGEQE